MTEKELYKTRKLWGHLFGYKFHKRNKDGTNWWFVYTKRKENFRFVSCSSILMCHKICYTAYQIINNKKVTFRVATRKAEQLVDRKAKYTKVRKTYKKKKYKEPSFLEKREEIKIIPLTKYKCPIHGVFEYNKEITECIRCINKVIKV